MGVTRSVCSGYVDEECVCRVSGCSVKGMHVE